MLYPKYGSRRQNRIEEGEKKKNKRKKTKDKKREKNIEIIMRAFDGLQFLFT